MSQTLSPTTTAVSIGAASRSAAARKRSGSGLAELDLVSRHDRYESRIDVERGEIDRGRFQAATGCDRPQDAGI